MDAIREVGPGSHFLGCAHTQANYQTAFWRSGVFDYRPFETWKEDGEPDTVELASQRVDKLLRDYEKPALDAAVEEALGEFVQKKKDSIPDAFA